MALNAKIRDRWEWNQISVSRPVRCMATETLHREVFVSRVANLLPHRVVRMFRPIVAILAKLNYGRLLQEKGALGAMGSVTGFAISFPNRKMG